MSALVAIGSHHALLDQSGPQSQRIGHLAWAFIGICAVAYLITLGWLVFGLVDARRRDTVLIEGDHDRGLARTVFMAVAVTTVTLLALLAYSAATGHAMAQMMPAAPLHIDITGRQWWWEVTYDDGIPSHRMSTANEVHIPVGRPVLLKMTSRDVIHSLWVPSLHGKRDLIPRHYGTLVVQADRPGAFRGQCAEFCGLQHAHMGIEFVADPPEQFQAWLGHQMSTPPAPSTSRELKGQQVFLGKTCALCHNVAGTPAYGRNGPDLTHLASRLGLAAGTLPNTRDALAAWIVDPQSVKPGSFMPATALEPDELQALLDYLETLN
jgi:cytochrome c oxidase subunit 2